MKSNYPTAEPFLPSRRTYKSLLEASEHCKGCDLYLNATHIVFGEGSKKAQLMLIGEQPGDKEDLTGKPFVGPAGQILNQALESAGFEREDVYITNAVKHFRFEQRGKRRLHKKPNSGQITACLPWLQAEIDLIKPKILVCLGASAAQAVLGKTLRINEARGKTVETESGLTTFITVHPSSILRIPDKNEREKAYKSFIKDFEKLRGMIR